MRYDCAKFHRYGICVTDFRKGSQSNLNYQFKIKMTQYQRKAYWKETCEGVCKIPRLENSKTRNLENFTEPFNYFSVSERHILYDISLVVIFHNCLKLIFSWSFNKKYFLWSPYIIKYFTSFASRNIKNSEIIWGYDFLTMCISLRDYCRNSRRRFQIICTRKKYDNLKIEVDSANIEFMDLF